MHSHFRRLAENGCLFGVSKNQATDRLTTVLSADDFPKVSGKPLGSHSIRKLPVTFARKNGCAKDDVDTRGRWKRW